MQPAHALAQFAIENPEIFADWHENHKNLIVLAVEDEVQLQMLWLKAKQKHVNVSAFQEPDINDELTALALEPCEDTYKMTSNIPLALRKIEPLALTG